MGRANPSLTTTPIATVGAGIGTTLRTAMAGGVLGNWTVSAMYTFGSGGTERNFWVLSAGFVEILVALNNSATNHHSSVWSGKRSTNNGVYMPVFWFAPDGGFIASFAAGEDPLNESFWTHITGTQAKREPTPGMHLQNFSNGYVTLKVYTIADDTTNMYMVMIGDRTGDDRYEVLIFADDLYVADSIDVAGELQPGPQGCIWIQWQDNATPPKPAFTFNLWDNNEDLIVNLSTDNDEIQGYLNSITGASITASGKVPTISLLIKTSAKIYCKANTDYIRIAPLNDPTTYKTTVGVDPDYGWVRTHVYFLVPWEDGASNPT